MTVELFLTSRFGLDRSVYLAQVAERAGLAGVWLAEHPLEDDGYGKCRNAIALASAILAATTRIRVGTAACVFTNWSSSELAGSAEKLGPRFHLGVARGRHGAPASFAPWLAALRREYAATIRVAAVSPSTVELAASLGMPLLLGVERTAAECAEVVRLWTSLSGHASADHLRVTLTCPPTNRLVGNLERWLRGIGSPTRDLSAHLAHLLRTRTSKPEQGTLCMVEATSSVEETAELIEALGSMC